MKTFGIIILLGGLLGLVAALMMDTSVSSGYGTVNNIGLMNDKQNYLIVSIAAIFLGFLMIVFDKSEPSLEFKLLNSNSQQAAAERPTDPEVLKAYAEALGVYASNGYYCFQKGKTKSFETALRWAEAAQQRSAD